MAKAIVRKLVPNPGDPANPNVMPEIGQIEETDDNFANPTGKPYFVFQIPEGLGPNEDPTRYRVDVTKVSFTKGQGNTASGVTKVG